jgi:nicotinate-nucleotide adenylyltransferase
VGTEPIRIGIFGGTFDPIHTAHVEVAEAVTAALSLDRMLVVVANQPWQKEGSRPVTPAEDRFAMAEAALVGRPGLEASRIEIDRGGPSYTVDTVRQLQADHPGARLFIVVGSDVVAGLTTWKDEASLRDQATLAVVSRPGAPPADPPAGWVWVDVPVEPVDLSSTELRDRLESGLPVDGLVPEAVMRCIHQRGLYATRR